ncbi:rod shape-determining protein MreC [Halothiobacillus sp.]|uniref:rod shape-determining protein MreC n=1 Tax=Halothiobacillus sp. TaxID=1891311 RepID=UPI003D0D2DBA
MTLFESHRPGITKLLVLVLLSVFLMALDRAGSSWVKQLNSGIGSLTDGIARIVHAPAVWGANLSLFLESKTEQVKRIRALEEENLLLKGQMQQFFDLQKQLNELRKLLHGQSTEVPNVLLARLIAVNDNPEQRTFTINRGIRDGVKPGQPVIDGQGIVGQILRSSLTGAVVLKIDSRHYALSVAIGDTGFVGIVKGTDTRDTLTMSRIPERFNVKVGDLLTTSGLDGVFPQGYPVARVTQVQDERSQAFVNITARPVADLDRISQVLVLTDPPDAPPPPDSKAEQASVVSLPSQRLIESTQDIAPRAPDFLAPSFSAPPATQSQPGQEKPHAQ